jgi:UDP-GlcNAc:polypeptide alpha-N-acetylglucosaminyltransferase
MQEVPFDPELPYLFMGEELLYSARLWTAGW